MARDNETKQLDTNKCGRDFQHVGRSGVTAAATATQQGTEKY